jgi:hypothetical protein
MRPSRKRTRPPSRGTPRPSCDNHHLHPSLAQNDAGSVASDRHGTIEGSDLFKPWTRIPVPGLKVMVYRMVSADTIEEKVMALKERTQALFDHPKSGLRPFTTDGR